jgi:hypothetical protein
MLFKKSSVAKTMDYKFLIRLFLYLCVKVAPTRVKIYKTLHSLDEAWLTGKLRVATSVTNSKQFHNIDTSFFGEEMINFDTLLIKNFESYHSHWDSR